ncbi:glycosyltransferase family 2 protein [Roseibium salinum]|nr:glycosyltransferase family 2 protein [Roseibium salinum]
MTDRLPLSAFIIARNEADRIARPIESVRGWVDEVVVIDSGSTDGTIAVAERLGAKVVHNEWAGYGPQKRFGEDQCRNDWLLNLDADEEVTPELAAEIRAKFADGSYREADGWRIMIRDMYAHENAPAPWAYGYHQIRLYDRRQGRFSDSIVHDTVRPEEGAKNREPLRDHGAPLDPFAGFFRFPNTTATRPCRWRTCASGAANCPAAAF